MPIRLFENFKVKLFSFFAASIFWFVVVTENDYQYDFDVPIVPTNIPADKIVIAQSPTVAKVRFRGRGKSLLRLRFSEEARIELDLSNAFANTRILLKDEMVTIPRRTHDISFIQVLSPDEVTVVLAQLARKKVPVIPQIEVEPVIGYVVVGGIKLIPDSIEVAGPQNYIASIQHVRTERKAYSGVKYRFTEKVKLQKFPDSLKISYSMDEVRFEVDLQKLLELEITEVPVRVINVPRGWKVTPIPSTVSLTVIGGEGLLMSLSRDDLKAYIDYSTVRVGDPEGHPVTVEAPPEVTVTRIHPERFKLATERQRKR